MIVSPSDHHISYAGAFSEALKRAIKGAEQGKLVTLGIKPTRPETGFGYLERGAQVSDQEHPLEGAEGGRIEPRCEVRRFVEKPSREVAERYLASGDFLWNSGLFVMSVERLLSEVARQLPELWAALEAIEPTIGTPEYEPVLAERFAALRSVSLDYGVMEGAEGVEVVPVELGWSDVGHWAALRELYPQDTEGNVKVGASHLTLEARDNVIYSERPVALLGVTGLVVAESNGALLICPAERSQEVRDVVEALKAQGQGELT
jgi:mannose-1-phosphate guanylyltransferase